MPNQQKANFFDELKRRSVFRVGAAYLVAAWLIIQIADTVFPYIGLSESTITFLIIFLAIGLVVALIVAWIFEITPTGIVRDEEAQKQHHPDRSGIRPFDYAVLAALTAIVTVFAFDRFNPSIEDAPLSTGAPSIAVLPFENRSASPEDVYFVEGIHDDILTSISKIGSLKVISRTSVERFTDADRSLVDIGAELGVTSILEGGVQRAGNSIRINVQLIDARTDQNLWAESFDRELTAENIFSIQSEIATLVAFELQTTLTPEESTQINSIPTSSLEAYEAYLLGNQRIRRRSAASLMEAKEYFETAIDRDSEFVLAWVGLATSQLLLKTYGDREAEELLEPSLNAINRAIELDPDSGEALATLGSIHTEFETGVDPEPLFRSAISKAPNFATARLWYGEYLQQENRLDEALSEFQAALELDPMSPIINAELAAILMDTGRREEAKSRLLRAIEIDPLFPRAYAELAAYYRNDGEWARSLVAAETANRLNPEQPANLAARASALIELGELQQATMLMEEANRLRFNSFVRFMTAVTYAVGDDDDAFQFALTNWDDEQIKGFTIGMLTFAYVREGEIATALDLLESENGFYALPDTNEILHPGHALVAKLYAYSLQQAERESDAAVWLDALVQFYSRLVSPGNSDAMPADEL